MQRTNLRPLKNALRCEVLDRRNALSAREIETRSRLITDHLLCLPTLPDAECVLAFASFGSEIQTMPLIEALLQAGKRVLLPKVNRATRTLDLYSVECCQTDLAPGTWDIPEPIETRCKLHSPRDVDFIVVPGVAFDLQGRRLGYGGGFYDDLLAREQHRLTLGQIVALAFELQIVPEVPAREKDIPVPYIMTEERLIRAEKPFTG
jgi:5-formyltetrahydrofolate cyclo-ligase